MMDTNENAKKSFAEKYASPPKPPYPALVKPAPRSDDEQENEAANYQALIKHREKKGHTPRFRVIDRQGQIFGCGYAYLLGWLYTPPGTLSIYTTTHAFILTGKHLTTIEKALMRENVEQLREFNPKTDLLPAEGEPLIEKMTVINRLEV